MALQNSGTITMDQIGREFRGPKPYDLQSHYRGGGKVPARIPGTMNPPTGGNPTRSVSAPTVRCDATGPWVSDGQCTEAYSAGCGGGASGPDSIALRTFACSNNIVSIRAPCGVSGPGSICGERWVSMTSFYTNYVPGVPGNVYGVLTAHEYQDGSSPPVGPNPPGPNPPNPIVPGNMNPPIPINTKVPNSGRIAVEDFYGARKP